MLIYTVTKIKFITVNTTLDDHESDIYDKVRDATFLRMKNPIYFKTYVCLSKWSQKQGIVASRRCWGGLEFFVLGDELLSTLPLFESNLLKHFINFI